MVPLASVDGTEGGVNDIQFVVGGQTPIADAVHVRLGQFLVNEGFEDFGMPYETGIVVSLSYRCFVR